MKIQFWWKIFLLFLMGPWGLQAAESLKADHIRVSVVAPQTYGEQGPHYFGILFEPDPEWHVYWKNPGDSGAAPKFKFLPVNSEIGPTLWPYPQRIPLGDLVNLGYDGRVLIPFELKIDSKVSVSFRAELEWLVCKEECIPGFGTLTMFRPVEGNESQWDAMDKALMDEFLAKIPKSLDSAPLQIEGYEESNSELKLRLKKLHDVVNPPDFLPVEENFLVAGSPQVLATSDGWEVVFKKLEAGTRPSQISFLMVVDGASWEMALPVQNGGSDTESFFVLLFFAFLGGIILNLMPCVFPVLSIKALALVKSGHSRERMVKEGLSYSAGVLVTFLLLGGIFVILRQAGAAIGWGFQLQSPLIVLLLTLLFWLMALNLMGFFEMGYGLMAWAGRLGHQGSSFTTGILSVFVAAPCTGPFMGSALGATAVLPSWQAMGIFISLGLGLAFPFIVLTLFPRALARLPKPGAWMERFKQFLAFPLFGTVIWLLWVLGQQIGEAAWVSTSSLLLGVAFLIWLGKEARRSLQWALLIVGFIAVGIFARDFSKISGATTSVGQQGAWKSFDANLIDQARAEGKKVFVDFTAAWCITCQWNKKAVLDTPPIQELFKQNEVLLIRADWTHHDEAITKALAAFGRNSVPLYVYYSDEPPQILPQILTHSMIEELFNKSKKEK